MRKCYSRASSNQSGTDITSAMRRELLWAKDFMSNSAPRVFVRGCLEIERLFSLTPFWMIKIGMLALGWLCTKCVMERFCTGIFAPRQFQVVSWESFRGTHQRAWLAWRSWQPFKQSRSARIMLRSQGRSCSLTMKPPERT